MQKLLNRIIGKQEVVYSSVIVTYLSESGMWRGFVMPYDITYEADTREKVVAVLQDMTHSYRLALGEYNKPTHLADVPLSYVEDRQKWDEISMNVVNKLLNRVDKIETPDYYAEAQLPA
ncbi:hypothetical protein A3G69_00935 [Candidatus Peribacteria bacterium RIFCSPLOWO2_12_FULL_53_10]|nr:MAG: hypothetical protein A3G69_00935 [Candidatus Peribacteria bacterium RIFCSPLOWO2_12_FULL_53_10]